MPKKGKKKDKAPKVSYYEALLGYKINLKEKELEDANFALKDITTKHENFVERNERLRQSRDLYMKKALKDYKVFTTQIDQQEKCEREDVLQEMKNLWIYQKGLEDELIDLRIQIKQVENEIASVKKDIKYWLEYKNRGKNELDMQIKLLKQEIEDMKENYEFMSKHIEDDLKTTCEFIKTNTEQSVSKEHKTAAEKIFKEMDKYTVQMMHDNKWMAEKVQLYTGEVTQLEQETCELEKENVSLMTRLFDCNTADLRVIKDAFQMQFLDNDNLEENSILDIDLEKLDTIRPKSSLEMALEKVAEYDNPEITEEMLSEIEETERSSVPTTAPESYRDYIGLGPYEYKSLQLKGYKKPIYRPKTPSKEETEAFAFKGDDWPITQEMLIELNLNS